MEGGSEEGVVIDDLTLLRQELELRIEQISILQRDLRETREDLSASESETYLLQKRLDDQIRVNADLRFKLDERENNSDREGDEEERKEDREGRDERSFSEDSEDGEERRANGRLNGPANGTGHLQSEISFFSHSILLLFHSFLSTSSLLSLPFFFCNYKI